MFFTKEIMYNFNGKLCTLNLKVETKPSVLDIKKYADMEILVLDNRVAFSRTEYGITTTITCRYENIETITILGGLSVWCVEIYEEE